MIFLTIKALHMIAAFSWFAAIIYLPRLFVYHSLTDDEIGHQRFCLMESRLYRNIANPAMMLTILLGIWLTLLQPQYITQLWWQIKVFFVVCLVIYQLVCKKYMLQLAIKKCNNRDRFFRYINEIPIIIIIIIIFCVALKIQ